jgi:ferrous iron transport protein A
MSGASVAWEGTEESVIVCLNELKTGEKGIVQQIDGGKLLMDRLNALGIRPGKEILKVSSMFTRGPITIQIDRTQIAIGLGMAKKILINTNRTKE